MAICVFGTKAQIITEQNFAAIDMTQFDISIKLGYEF